MKIDRFYLDEYLSFASYDNYRKIGSYVDGLKPSARKCIYTVLRKNITQPKKVSSLKALVADTTSYIHGDGSLIGVIVNLAQNFIGTNNIPLLKREGNFGNRAQPSNSADRYIFTCKEDYLEYLFMDDDNDVLIEQVFEGDLIEPKYYVPTLPLLLINGSEGVSVGFAQKILSRNPLNIANAIKEILDGNKVTQNLLPYYKGFTGDIIEREDGGFEIRGKFKKVGQKIIIEELPIGYDLKSYKKVLNTLEEKKIISDYIDLTDTKKDKFKFEIKYKDIDLKSDLEIMETLKLIKRVSENFTAMDENNIIRIFESPEEMLRSFVKIKLEYYEKRKEHKIEKLEYEIKILKNKLKFITDVINGKIVISNKTKQNIIEQLDNLKYYDKIEDSYDYLLRMQIFSLTSEKIMELKDIYVKTKEDLNELRNKNIKNWYKEDIDVLLSKIGGTF